MQIVTLDRLMPDTDNIYLSTVKNIYKSISTYRLITVCTYKGSERLHEHQLKKYLIKVNMYKYAHLNI